MEELVKAFRIFRLNMEPTTWDMEFIPITINKGHDAMGLFVQDNENGRFYSRKNIMSTTHSTSLAVPKGHWKILEEARLSFMT